MSDAWLAGPLTSAAYGWRLERRDGVTMGFTSHDRNVEIGGLLYRASPGMEPTAISESLGLESGGLEISGAINHAAIRRDDLSAGRWDGADLRVFLFDWTNPDADQRHLISGRLGEVRFSDNEFDVELDGAAARLNLPVVPLTSPGCRAQFCDADCGLNYRRYYGEYQVAAADGDQITLSGPLPDVAGGFAYGQLRWLDGPNGGLFHSIIASEFGLVRLAEYPPSPILPGAKAAVLQGCDKTLATCSGRFHNAINFRGEPFLPGNDLLTRFPGDG